MQLLLRGQDWRRLFYAASVLSVLLYYGYKYQFPALTGGVIILSVLLLLTAQLSLFRKLQRSDRQRAAQAQEYGSLVNLLIGIQPRAPITPLMEWRVSSAFTHQLINLVLEHKPRLTVFLGSGEPAPLLAGYVLKKMRRGALLAIDENERRHKEFRRQISIHGLGRHLAIRHVELEQLSFGKREMKWFAPSAFHDIQQIDLLVIDGPEPKESDLPRYPVMPVLYQKLSAEAVILIRVEKKNRDESTIGYWQMLYPDLTVDGEIAEDAEFIVLQRSGMPKSQPLSEDSNGFAQAV